MVEEGVASAEDTTRRSATVLVSLRGLGLLEFIDWGAATFSITPAVTSKAHFTATATEFGVISNNMRDGASVCGRCHFDYTGPTSTPTQQRLQQWSSTQAFRPRETAGLGGITKTSCRTPSRIGDAIRPGSLYPSSAGRNGGGAAPGKSASRWKTGIAGHRAQFGAVGVVLVIHRERLVSCAD